jgi:hypothetical protein
MFDMKNTLSKAVAEVLYDMLTEILEGLEEDATSQRIYRQVIDELRRPTFTCELERELTEMFSEKIISPSRQSK